jgi:glycerophosphoryl diester phosphodiesterase
MAWSMTTEQHNPATPRRENSNYDERRPLGRTLSGAGLTLAIVLVLILDPAAANVYAVNMFGALRAPGESAFVAGHRGDRAEAPENTIPALQAALDSGMEFVETDIQLSADGVPVIIHDLTVDRTTNGTGAVEDLTLAELKSLDAGSWFDPAFAGTTIPTLGEFLGIFSHSRKKALLELKGFWTRDEVGAVIQAIYATGVQNRVVFASFDFTTLRNIEAVGPVFPRVIIRRDLPADPVRLAEFYGAIAILTSPGSVERAPDVVDVMHEAGIGILLYTLNKESRWSEALALGVDGIVTDQPSALDKWLATTAPGT